MFNLFKPVSVTLLEAREKAVKNRDKAESLVSDFMKKILSDIDHAAGNGVFNLVLSFKDSREAYNTVFINLKKMGFAVKKVKGQSPREYFIEVDWT